MISDKDKKRMEFARFTAKESDDKDRQVGCVIVSSDGTQAVRGYNHFMIGVKRTEDKLTKPEKYSFFVHAEEAALNEMVAGHNVFNSVKSTAYVTLFPCARCFRELVYAGVVRFVIGQPENDPNYPEKYKGEMQAVKDMARDLGIKIDYYESAPESV